MNQPILNPGDTIGAFTILDDVDAWDGVFCFQAEHSDGVTKALVYVRDRRGIQPDPEQERAFQERAETLKQKPDPLLPALLAADVSDVFQWAAFSFPAGLPLRDWLWERGKISPIQGAALLRDICALFRALPKGSVHGMLESKAIYVSDTLQIRQIAHWGIVPLFGIRPPFRMYQAPEQWSGEHAIDHRADIYAAAAIVWEAIVGDEPGARSGHDPDRETRLKQRIPELCSARADVHKLFSDVLFDWTSHDIDERPRGWNAAYFAMNMVIADMNETAAAGHTAPDLMGNDSEPPTRPIPEKRNRVTIQPPPLEHADTIPAPAPKPTISSIPPTPRTAGDFPAAPFMASKVSPSQRAPKNRKRAFALGFAGFALMMAGIAIVWNSPHPPFPPEITSAKAGELARLLREHAALEIALKQSQSEPVHNSDVANSQAAIAPQPSRNTRSKQPSAEPKIPADRHAFDTWTEHGVYMEDRQH